jgi:hypothetical protein
MNALVGAHRGTWGMPNHGQHVLVCYGLSAAYATPVDGAARRTSAQGDARHVGTDG